MDREKVIKGLECCSIPEGDCEQCPYKYFDYVADCTSELSKNALVILKEQEAQIKKFELERSWDESPDMMGKW